MSSSLIAQLVELKRAQRTGDGRWCQQLPWLFRVVCQPFKGPCGSDGTALFPLPVAPENFSYDLPFGLDITALQESGTVRERGGLAICEISISGSMGFKLRPQRTLTFAPSNSQFTGLLSTGGGFMEDISPQMQWWQLANRCFEGYGQLARDPVTGPKTRMELHVFKDRLHLEVEPRKVRLDRSAARGAVTYRYDIQLAVVGAAKAVVFNNLEKSAAEQIADTISRIRAAVQSIAATLQDVNAAFGALSRVVSNLANLVGDLGSICSAGTDLINGAKSVVNLPRKFILEAADACAAAADAFAAAVNFPADVEQAFRQLEDNCLAFTVAARDKFQTTWEAAQARYSDSAAATDAGAVAARTEALTAAEAAGTAGRGGLSPEKAFATAGIRPGDALRASTAQPAVASSAQSAVGWEQRMVQRGDTLAALATRYLGTASRWRELVIANRLAPPYVAEAPLLGVLGPGSALLVPVVSARQQQAGVVTTGEPLDLADAAKSTDPLDVALGVDLALVERSAPGGGLGLEVDTAGGSVDARMIGGMWNLEQALLLPLRYSRGEAPLFPDQGLPVAVGGPGVTDAEAQLSLGIREQILADRRVEQLLSFSVSGAGDALLLEASILPVGGDTARPIARTIR